MATADESGAVRFGQRVGTVATEPRNARIRERERGTGQRERERKEMFRLERGIIQYSISKINLALGSK